MSLYVVDVEANSKTPASGSMVCFGAVKVADMDETFYGQVKPISDKWNPDALAISGFSREEHEKFDEPDAVMLNFYSWIHATSNGRPIFITDNPAFDFMWIAYYFDMVNLANPFGYSARRIGDLYCGMQMDAYKKWKHLRDTKHTHHPVDDAKGNAEVIVKMKGMGLNIKL
jgi:hypothetical protein